ncbi:TetR/AcrR family transcriptional regulator [Actinoplanes sp. NPDC049265]|uniref:TetR/AcrR family transcriptional regulator n=1 Tax=Actinoplanes sp. NPDC049265 TaxID=3363902 RepID=UPI003714A430
MPRVSEDHLTARREQILAAARACFLRNGLHATTMQDLIREADLSIGAVYRYFKSKNEIISAIAEQVAGGITVRIQEIAAQQPPVPLADAMDQVLDLIEAQVGPGGNFPLGVQVWGEATIDPAIGDIVRERYAGMHRAFEIMAERAAGRGELPAGSDPAAVGAVLFSMVPGFALQRMIIGKPDKETFAAGVRTILAR